MNAQRQVAYATVVGQAISWMRQLARLEQADIANAVGVSQSTWSRIERGESALTVEQFAKAAKALGRTPSEIMQAVDQSVTNLALQGVEVLPERPDPKLSGAAILSIAALALLIAGAIKS